MLFCGYSGWKECGFDKNECKGKSKRQTDLVH